MEVKKIFKGLLFLSKVLILYFAFALAIFGLYSYFKNTNDQEMLIQFFWNLILLCFVLGTLILSITVPNKKYADRDLRSSGFIFVVSGLFIFLGIGLEFSGTFPNPFGGEALLSPQWIVEVGKSVALIGLALLPSALTFLLLESYRRMQE